MTYFPTLSYTSAREIANLFYTWSLKKGASPYRPLCGVSPGIKSAISDLRNEHTYLLDKQNTCTTADRTTGKLTLQDINTTPKELKTDWDVATDSCFSLFGARQYGVTTRENSDEKYPRTDVNRNLELSTLPESRHTKCLLGGQESKYQVDVSQRKWRNGQKPTMDMVGQNHAKITAYWIYKRSTAPKYIKYKH